MIENRELWLSLVFEVEGGFVNDKADSGGSTNMGITQKTLADWRGDDVGPEDVAQLTKEEATSIYLARYWQAVRGDQLPAGLDIYCADFAVNSGPARAAKILQKLVDAEADSFIGPKTMEAVRKCDPLKLLLSYHAARMQFLLGLSAWDTFSRGWTNRCNRVFAVAKDQVQKRPALAEAAGSSIVKTNATVATASGGTLAWLIAEHGSDVLAWMQDWTARPENVEKLQSGVQYIAVHGQAPLLAAMLAAVCTVVLGASGFSAWRRMRMWWRGTV